MARMITKGHRDPHRSSCGASTNPCVCLMLESRHTWSEVVMYTCPTAVMCLQGGANPPWLCEEAQVCPRARQHDVAGALQ